jgi:hypothetical protein
MASNILHQRLRLGFPLLIVLLALAPPAAASDPLAAAFKQAAKAAVKAVKAESKTATKLVKVGLKAAAKDYGDGTLDASAAIAAALEAMTFDRDALADAARDAVAQLAADGVSLLEDAGASEPGADFQAGGRGAWDDALQDIEKAMDKADGKFTAAFSSFVKDMGKSAKKLDAVIDIRWRVPEHGDEFWSILPPLLLDGTLTGAKAFDVAPPQVLVEARFVATDTAERLGIGGRFNDTSAGVIVSSELGEALEVGSLFSGAGDTGSGTFALGALQSPASFINLLLATTSDKSARDVLSAPRLTDAPAADAGILADFEQDLKDDKQAVTTACASALAILGGDLDSHVEAVKQDLATVEVALHAGFADLRDAREAMAVALQNARGGTVLQLQENVAAAGFDDADFPSDFAPDGLGLYRDAADAQAKKLAKSQDKAAQRFRVFVGKILDLAEKKGQLVGANVVTGRTHRLAPPMVTVLGPSPIEEVSPTHLTDGMVVRVTPVAGPDDFTALMLVQTDPALHPTVSLTATTLLEGDTLDLGQISSGAGGTGSAEPSVVGDAPLLGWIFRARDDSEPHEDLLILIKPDIVGGE